MANLNDLLKAKADDLKAILFPVGTWHARLKSVKLKAKATDKNYDEYIPAICTFTLTGPFPDVDEGEVAALKGQLEDEAVFTRENLYRNSDFVKLTKKLKALGVPSAGRTLVEMAKEVSGEDVVIEIEHEEYEGEPRNKVKAWYAPDST